LLVTDGFEAATVEGGLGVAVVVTGGGVELGGGRHNGKAKNKAYPWVIRNS